MLVRMATRREETDRHLPEFLKKRRTRLGYIGDGGIEQVADAAAVPPERWREFERGDAAPAPEELPRIALALVHPAETGPADDPGTVLAQLRRSVTDVT
jgi:hypothetical protein